VLAEAVLLDANRVLRRERIASPADEARPAIRAAEADAHVGAELVPALLERHGVPRVAGGGFLGAQHDVHAGGLFSLRHEVGRKQEPDGVLLAEVGDPELQARIGAVPQEGFGFGDGARHVERAEIPVALGLRARAKATGHTERASGFGFDVVTFGVLAESKR